MLNPTGFRKPRIILPPRRANYNHGFGIAAANNAPPLIGSGTIWPGGLVSPNPWDSWDFTSKTDLSQVPDSTGAVQNAINAAQALGTGGVVQLPAGVIRVNNVTISSGGLTIKGTGWEENIQGASPAARGKRGTYILSDSLATNGTAFTVGTAASNVKIQDVAFIQPYAPDAAGWTDIFNGGPSILLQGPSSGGVLIEKCMFWGVSTGIQIGDISGGSHPAGLITIRDCEAAAFFDAIYILSCTTMVIDNLKSRPDVFLANNTNQLTYIRINASGVQIENTPSLVISNSQFSGNTAIFGVNLPLIQSLIKISDCDISNCIYGVQDFGNNNIWKIAGFTFTGAGAGHIDHAIYFGGTTATYDVTDCYLKNSASSPVLINTNGADIRFGPNLWVDNWNLSPGLDGSVPNPSPALTVKTGSTCRYSLNGSRFTNANGGPNTGGGGTFTTY